MTREITEEKIDHMIGMVSKMSVAYVISDSIIFALERLRQLEKRNAILEAAVAWHGFDELPDGSKGYFEIKYLDGTLGAGTLVIYESDVFVKMLRHGNIRLGDAHKFAIGWRYPVGDLSE